MTRFIMTELENLKRSGLTPQDIHFQVTNALQNADKVSANIRSLNQSTGEFEIVLTGILDTTIRNSSQLKGG